MKRELFMKEINGDKIYCLEYDKETLKDMVIYLQERIDKAIEYIKDNPKLLNDKLYQNDKDTSFIFINNKIKSDLLNILEGEEDAKMDEQE